MPATVVKFAVANKVNVGRDEHGVYFVRDPKTLARVETTRSAKPTAANALAMIRRYLEKR